MKKIILSLSLFPGLNSYAQDYYRAIRATDNIGLYNLLYTSVSQNNDFGGTAALGCPMIVYKSELINQEICLQMQKILRILNRYLGFPFITLLSQ